MGLPTKKAKLNWADRVKLWVACENLAFKPEKLKLIVLACNSELPAKRVITTWDMQSHQETGEWIVKMLSREPAIRIPTLSRKNKFNLANIPEVSI